jgi:ABC-2 type transport system ATP-binding protein
MIVRLEDLHKSFAHGFLMHRRHVLQGLSLELEAGDCYGLLGDNGAGKSTTLRILLGLSRPDRGGGELLGRPLGDRAARRALGYLPETPTFHEGLTAGEFLRFGGQLLGLGGADLERRAQALLERVELGPARHLRLRKMSKGMLQRLGLAQALLGDPELLVLDEPMSGLDPHGRKLVRDLILEQRAQGRTLLFSTHILSDVEMVCNRAGMLRGGRLARELRVQDLGSLQAHSVEVLASGLGDDTVRRLAGLARATLRSGGSVLFTVSPGTPARELVQAVLAQGGELQSVTPRRASLEEVFLAAGSERAAAPSAAPPPSPPVAPRRTSTVGSR